MHHAKYFFASDVWSVGVIIWQMLTGHTEPYPEVPNIMMVATDVVQGRLDLRKSLPERGPDWARLVSVALACLDPEPTRRPEARLLQALL